MYFILENNTVQQTPPDPYKGEKVKAVIITNPNNSVVGAYLHGSFKWCGVENEPSFEQIVESLPLISVKQ
jgi:hypothetical protein